MRFDIRWSVRAVLFLPVLVAAFFAGWSSHRKQLEGTYMHDLATAAELRGEYHRAALAERLGRQISRDEAMIAIDRFDHQNRMKRFHDESHMLIPHEPAHWDRWPGLPDLWPTR